MKLNLLNKFWSRVCLLATVMTTALVGTAWADEAVFDFTTMSAVAAGEQSFTEGQISITCTNGAVSLQTSTMQLRWYANQTLTVSADDGYEITAISITKGANDKGTISLAAGSTGTLSGQTGSGQGNVATWSGTASSVSFTTEGQSRVTNITVTYQSASGVETVATPTFSPAGGAYTEPQYVTLTSATGSATIYYTTDGTEPSAESNVYEDPIYVEETTTIKAIAYCDGMNASSVATATYTFVTLEHAGTEADPYSVADARTAIDANTGTQGVYVTGIVTEIPTEWSTEYNNISFNFVDSEGDNNFLQAYRCVSTEAADASTVEVGDIVVVYGNLTYYESKQLYEFEAACQLVSIVHPGTPVAPVIVAEDVTLGYDATTGEIAYSIENPLLGTGLTATTEAEWISNINVGYEVITFTTTANEGNADRTATIVLTYSEVTKTVTVTQEHYVAPVSEFATLPFEFDGGVADIAETSGLTQEGIDKDYAASPYLKFNTTGDYLILAFDERPGVLTFDIKGNGFSGGTFTVQASEDGEAYSDVATYTTELASGDVLSKTINNLGEDVRYIKWIYTEKSSGNVGLGNIKLAAYTGPVPTITVTPTTLTLVATTRPGYQKGFLDLEYNDIVVENILSFTIQFYDAEGEELDDSEWLNVGVIGNNDEGYNVQCTTLDNEGEARTAYFKVYALDSDDNRVYSELITVTQEAYIEPATPGNWVETALADITPNDIFVIVADNGNTYAMSNDNGTQAGPTAVAVTVTDNTLSGDVPANIQWQLSVGEEGYTFYPYGDAESWLYCTNTNNGVRVGTNANKVFTLNATSGYLVNSATGRYMGVYNSQDWRCYTSISTNIQNQTFKFYKKYLSPLLRL